MNRHPKLCICSCGAATPLGTSAAMSSVMVHAEQTRILRHPAAQDENGRPVIMGIGTYADDRKRGVDRMILFLSLALDEALGKITGLSLASRPLFVLVGLPEYRPGFGKDQAGAIHHAVLQHFQTHYPGTIHLELIPRGHGAFIAGLHQAREGLSDNKTDLCVVCGVDSYYDEDTLMWLQSCDRLKSPDNRFGFIPGEGAGCVIVAHESVAQRKGWPVRAMIRGMGMADEPCPMGADGVCTGQGLSRAMAQALEAMPEQKPIDQILGDLNGERYRADEFGFSMLRHGRAFKDTNRLITPVHQWGDLGAAAGPNLVNLHMESGKSGFGPLSMIVTSSDSGRRGALIIESVQQILMPS